MLLQPPGDRFYIPGGLNFENMQKNRFYENSRPEYPLNTNLKQVNKISIK